MKQNEIYNEVCDLYEDIDACINRLVRSRMEHSKHMEHEALLNMESLLVQSQQMFAVVRDYLMES